MIIAFDIYGTLIDTEGIVGLLARLIGDQAPGFSRMWREKQLEYSFRRGLMRSYQDFSVCTAQALLHANLFHGSPLSAGQMDDLMAAYGTLPPFSDANAGLKSCKEAGHRLFAFSNGRADSVRNLLINARLIDHFEDIVSADEIRTLKPDPAVYAHFLKRSGADKSESWLVSSNPFDVLGAISAGMQSAWIRRSPAAIFDPWGTEPTLTLCSLSGLAQEICST